MPFEPLESLESRRLFAFDNWGPADRLIQLPDALAAYATTSTDITGAGQAVAVIDSGIDYTHPSLGGGFGAGHKVIAGYNFVNNNTDVLDTYGHGTEVAGLIAADQFQAGGLTYQGIAPGADLIALRVAIGGESVPDQRIDAALQWVIDHRTQYNITVVNISYGTGDYNTNVISNVYGNEIQTLTDAGVTIVSSAGNNNTDTGALPDGGINTPAADPNVISVGSVNAENTISDFSYRGRVLSLLAPGADVFTTLKSADSSTPGGGGFGDVGGTSFASPIVAGTVAIMKSLDPTLVEKDALSILRASGTRTFDGDDETGVTTRLNYSRLDVLNALKLTQARTPASPTLQAAIGRNGNGNVLAVDAEGVTHYVYYDSAARTMKYATRNTLGEWSDTQEIDNSEPYQGYYVSMAIDPQGQPAVAYFDGQDGDLKFARYDGVSWNVQSIDTRNSVGLYPSLTFDLNGLALISYYRKTTGDLKVAREALDGTFTAQSIDTRGDVGRSTSAAVDANGRIGVAYEDTSHHDLKFAVLPPRGKTWAATTVDAATPGGASFISLAFSPADNNPWISYYDAGPADLKVARFQGRTWSTTRVDSRGATGLYTTLFFADQAPDVLYYDKRQDSLMIASFNTDAWTFTTLKTSAGRFAFGALDPTDDIVRYSYYDLSTAALRVDSDVP